MLPGTEPESSAKSCCTYPLERIYAHPAGQIFYVIKSEPKPILFCIRQMSERLLLH